MKKNTLIPTLEAEAERFKAKAQDHALAALHQSADGRSISELDARLIRDHEIRSETYRAAARFAASHP